MTVHPMLSRNCWIVCWRRRNTASAGGRHWLDTARYADTKGEIRQQREDKNYPFAWIYRDYVIRSFNEDKPYNVFIAEQIAADKLSTTSLNRSNLAALGFLTDRRAVPGNAARHHQRSH